jgi:glutathione S-transferase
LKKAEDTFHRDAAILDARLAKHQFLATGTLTLADFAVASYLHYAVAAKLPWERYDNLRAWYARIEALPAWRDTKPAM